MKLHVSCDACGKSYQVDEQYAGKRSRCRHCSASLRIPFTAPIQLGAAGMPIPAPSSFKKSKSRQVFVEPIKGSPRFRPDVSKPPKAHNPLAWIGILVSFLLAIAAAVGITMLVLTMRTPAAVPESPPEISISVNIPDQSRAPDFDGLRIRVLELMTKQLTQRGITVTATANVKAIATIRLQAQTLVPISATQPGEVQEDLIDTELNVIDSSGSVIWHSIVHGEKFGVNMNPQGVPRAAGMTLQQAVQLAQWSDAGERFATMPYPPAKIVREAQINIAATRPDVEPKKP